MLNAGGLLGGAHMDAPIQLASSLNELGSVLADQERAQEAEKVEGCKGGQAEGQERQKGRSLQVTHHLLSLTLLMWALCVLHTQDAHSACASAPPLTVLLWCLCPGAKVFAQLLPPSLSDAGI